jgi:hypothetical protein
MMRAIGTTFAKRQKHSWRKAIKGLSSRRNNLPTQSSIIPRISGSKVKAIGAISCVTILGIASLTLRSNAETASQSQPKTTGATDSQLSNVTGSTAPTVAPNSANSPTVNTPGTNSNANTTNAVTSSSNTTNGATTTSVTVNGQPVNVPANGSTQQTVSSPDGQTTVNVSSTQSTGSNGTNSSVHQANVDFSSSSSSATEDNNSP